jgi:putative tricarboxylic transport membrane protein
MFRDVPVALVLVGLGIFVTLQGSGLNYLDEFGPGPGFLPYWLGLILTALASLLTLFALRRRGESAQNSAVNGLGRALLAAAGLVAMAAVLEIAGFLASFALLSFFLVYVIERRSVTGAVTVAVILTLSFLVLFRMVLPSALPTGPWGF